MAKPNIFKLATKELTQDGFFTWFIQWADPSNCEFDHRLHECAQSFVKKLVQTQISDDIKIEKVTAGRQWENIDIWAEVNDEILIIIEDKTFTGEHSNQLENYKKIASDWCAKNNYRLVCIYLKTGSEAKSSLDKISQKGFSIIDRKELVAFLKTHDIDNDIYNDFKENIIRIEQSVDSFKILPINKWHWNSWEGFYKFLESHIKVSDWRYVSNPSGGFLGLWWHFLTWKSCYVYLQIEQGNLCFKLGEVYENHSELRNEWYSIIMKKAKAEGLTEIKKPQRFGSGTYMTVAVIERQNWLGKNDTLLSCDAVIDSLKKYEAFLDSCVEQITLNIEQPSL